MREPTDAEVEKAFRAHIGKLAKQAAEGDRDAIRSLACMALIKEGFRVGPDPDDGEKIIDFSKYRLAASHKLKACDHIPMKAALDDEIGCIRCGQWLGKGQ